ncbi:MAG TPA: hypothetical protein VFM07_11635 [Intrasporangium sp.]|nr:hypothetical protein [Intrasporangium sp.]
MKKQSLAAAVAVVALPGLALLTAAPAHAAGSGGVAVTNTETVQAYLDASGRLDVARVYEQVAMRGTGTVDLNNPVETSGLRNLDGFGGFDVEQGRMVGRYDVDGERRLRTVSDYTKKLPLEVSVSYTLDGKQVQPEDVVGRSGRLEVRYTVRNVTATPHEVTFDDGTGAKVTATEQVVIPMVGSLTTTLPAGFTNVASDEANIAGDGRGGTKLTFTMTLFGPIGAPEASFGYSAQIADAVVPKASISALPVSPLDSPSFKGGAASYKGGADTGATLTAGATEIDSNLLKLRDGASTLLAGLIQLRDGAKQLDAGLGAQIVPGSRQLASGAGDLKDGTSKLRAGASEARGGGGKLSSGAKELSSGAKELDSGVGRLKGGAAQVDDGAGQLADGAKQLDTGAGQLAAGLVEAGAKAPALLDGLVQVADGLDLVDDGLVTMYGGIGQLPAKAQPLHDGIAQLRAGIGARNQAGDTLLYGVEQVRAGLAQAVSTGDSLDVLKGGVDQVQAGTAGAIKPGGGIDQLEGGVQLAQTTDCGPGCQAVLDKVLGGIGSLRADMTKADGGLVQVSGGLGELKGKLGAAAAGLARIECGLSNQSLKGVCDPEKPGLLEGLAALDAGVGQLVDGVVKQVQGGIGGDKDTAKDKTLRGGVHSLQDGVDQIGLGGLTLLDGLGQLSDGAMALKAGTGQLRKGSSDLKAGTGQLAAGTVELKDGSGRLASGAGQLSDGAGQLSSGLGTLADGTVQLDDGAGQLSDGARQLADGLGTAADGASKIAGGLDEAADGAPALQDGAQRLSDEGTKKLVEAGKATATDYGQKYALIEAVAKRAKQEGMAYGAPEGAAGFTAYSLELAGLDGEGSRNVGRAAGALGAFTLGGGLLWWRRRFF